MTRILSGLLLALAVVAFTPQSHAEGTKVRPGIVGGTSQPNSPAAPQNPSQSPTPSAPGVIVTYPNNPPTKGSCSRDGKSVPC